MAENSRNEAGHSPSLAVRLLSDVTSAAVASTLVSPLVSVIDVTVVTKASTGASLRSCLRSSLQQTGTMPIKFLKSKPFLLLFSVYFGTYTTANCIDTFHSEKHHLPPATVSATSVKFIGTTAVSTGLCVFKDGQFARLYGASVMTSPVPAISYALFTARDAVTIFASFILPSLAAPSLAQLSSTAPSPARFLFASEESSLKSAQMLSPAAIQFVSTPIHLLGLDLHNRRRGPGWRDRVRIVGRDLSIAIPLRMLRIIPAFGIGNVLNTSVRSYLMNK